MMWNIWKAQWKNSYLTFQFAGNGLAPVTHKYCDLNANLACSAMDANCNLQCPKLTKHNRIYRDVSFSMSKLPTTSRVPTITFWICGNVVYVFNDPLLASHKICDRSPDNIAGTLGCVFIDNETHESGVTKCTTDEAWSAFSWHHSSVFHCQWTHNQVFLLLSHMLILNAKSIFIYMMKYVSGFIWTLGINFAVFIKWIDET